MKLSTRLPLILLAVALWNPSSTLAQERVSALGDLVGAKGSSGEAELEARGYEFVRTTKSDDSAYSFWKEPRSGRCVSVRTAEGRYATIVYTPDADCHSETAQAPAASNEKKSFETVCGVEAAGKKHRYKCRVRYEGCQGEGYCRTVLTYPDNELLITWHKGTNIEVGIQGVQAEKTTSSVRDGQTRFEFGGNTYFFYRSEKRARQEVAKFRP